MASCSGDSQQDQISLPPPLEVSFPITEVGGAERCNLKDEESDHYPKESIPQGQCLIVNVAHFLQHKERIGSDIDAEKLQNLFQNILNFVVTRVDDPTLPELQQRLKTFFQMDHSAYDAFFIIILSHGDPGDVIYTSDSQSIKISEISDHFTASNCPTLANKPKVFIVQACRGQKHHTPVVATVSHSHRASQDQTILGEAATTLCDDLHMANTFISDTEMAHDEQTANLDVTMSHTTSPHSGSQHDDPKSRNMSHDGGGFSTHNSNTTIQTIPDKKDFYYAFATIDDHEALRHRTDGSWFIYEFFIAVKQFAHKYGYVYLQELMLKVTERLSKHSYEDRMQVCEVKSSSAKKIILSINTKNGPISSPPSEASSLHSLFSAGEMVASNRPSLPSSRSCSKSSSRHELVLATATPPLSPFITRADTWSASIRHSTSSPSLGKSRHYTAPGGTLIVPSVSGRAQKHRPSETSLPHPLSRSSAGSSLAASHSSLPGAPSTASRTTKEMLGYCIVINNNDYKKMKEIRGVFSDQLGFHVQVYSDLTRKGIKHLLEMVANVDHTDLSYLVVVLLGNGKFKDLELCDIVKPFKNLSTVPKLFFAETKLNEKGYESFYNKHDPIDIPHSYINYVNATTDIEETFLQCLLQTITATTDTRIVFQDLMRSALKVFKKRESSCKIDIIDNVKDSTMVLHKLKCQTKEGDQGKEFKYEDLLLAAPLLSLVRDETIKKLRGKRGKIMQISKTSGTRALPFRGRSGSETRAILKAKLEKTQAALEVDRQLVQQVNELISKSPTRLEITGLIIPPELSELISMCTKLYKTSEEEAMSALKKHIDSLDNEHVNIKQLCTLHCQEQNE